MAPLAIFESFKGWLLYTGIAGAWGDPNVYSWLFRGDSLRAQAAANHSINLGFHLSMALGFYLFLRTRGVDRFRDIVVLGTLLGGIVVTYSRGAWITAIVLGVLFVASRPDAARRLAGALVALTVLFALMYVSPLKESVLDRLPFIGTADQDTIEYRRVLAEVSWSLIQQHPFFGDPFVASRMESLRARARHHRHRQWLYVHGALQWPGGLGAAGRVLASRDASRLRRLSAEHGDRDAATLGAALLACMVAALVYVATAGYNETLYVLFGLSVSYAVCCRVSVPERQVIHAVDQRRAMSSRTQ